MLEFIVKRYHDLLFLDDYQFARAWIENRKDNVITYISLINLLSGSFDGGKSFVGKNITKWEMRRQLVFICKFAVNARPSRGNLKQVFGFLSRERERLVNLEPDVHAA